MEQSKDRQFTPSWLLSKEESFAPQVEKAVVGGIAEHERANSLKELLELAKHIRTTQQHQEKLSREILQSTIESAKNNEARIRSVVGTLAAQVGESRKVFDDALDQSLQREIGLERRLIAFEEFHQRVELEFKKLQVRFQLMETISEDSPRDRPFWYQIILSLTIIALLLANLTVSLSATDGVTNLFTLLRQLM